MILLLYYDNIYIIRKMLKFKKAFIVFNIEIENTKHLRQF